MGAQNPRQRPNADESETSFDFDDYIQDISSSDRAQEDVSANISGGRHRRRKLKKLGKSKYKRNSNCNYKNGTNFIRTILLTTDMFDFHRLLFYYLYRLMTTK